MRRFRRALGLLVLLALGTSASCSSDPVYDAVKRGDAAELDRLLVAGADPNRVTTFTQSGHSGATFQLTPLAIAAQRGDVATIERLVAAGADPTWDDGRFTAFEWAIRFEHPDAARRLWELSDGASYASRGAVHIPLALRMGDQATLDFVLEQVGVDGCDAASALMPLARRGSKGTEGDIRHVRALLDRGVHPTAEALHWAVREARPQMVDLLLDAGERRGWSTDCFVEFPDFDPLGSSLRLAVVGLEIDMVRHLLERGADPDARDAKGATALMWLTREVYLKETYARPPYSEQVLASPSPYHEKWFVPLFDLLMAHGADPSLRDLEGRTAADYVPDDDHDRALKLALLRAAGGAPAARGTGSVAPDTQSSDRTAEEE
jgi:ankyrin repeat protein